MAQHENGNLRLLNEKSFRDIFLCFKLRFWMFQLPNQVEMKVNDKSLSFSLEVDFVKGFSGLVGSAFRVAS